MRKMVKKKTTSTTTTKSTSDLARAVRILKQRCVKYKTQLKHLSDSISDLKKERKQLRRKRNIVTDNEIITWKKEKVLLREKIKEQEEMQTKFKEKLAITKKRKLPKYELLLWKRPDVDWDDYYSRMRKYERKKSKSIPRKKSKSIPNNYFHEEVGEEVDLEVDMTKTRLQYTPIDQLTDEQIVNSFDKWERERARSVVDKLRIYFTQLEESEGFDIDLESFPGCFFGVTSLVPLAEDYIVWGSSVDYKWMGNYALSKFNNENNTDFEYVKLLKASAIRNFISTFYITFSAHEKETSTELVTFQAIVACNSRYPEWENHSCSLVRLKETVKFNEAM